MSGATEIVELVGDVARAAATGCRITATPYGGEPREIDCPSLHYVFGNGRYVKERLDELSKTPAGNAAKFPLVALFCPFKEKRDSGERYTRASVNLLIACSTARGWSNEQRLVTSFQRVLRPIYRALLDALRSDPRLDFGYGGVVAHEYSENYSYGRYGAYTDTGEEVSEPIDAINVTNLELKIKNPTCR